MFVRVKTTPNSPRKSVQIVQSTRINGKVRQRIVKHIGVALDDEQLEELQSLAHCIKVKLELSEQLPIYTPDEILKLEKYNKKPSKEDKNRQELKKAINQEDNNINRADYDVNLLDMIEEDRIIKGIHDVYGKLYDELGFDKLLYNPARNVASCKALKEIVLARVANPDSKRGSVLNLQENFAVNLDLKAVYKMMDKIEDKEILKLNKLVYNNTKSLFKDKIDIVYFDATTLYFESFDEDMGDDAIRKKGFSKDGKFNQPQVVLALFVSKGGLPIGYKAFPGNTFDGHTIIPALQEVQEHYNIDNVVFVADAGMFNKANLSEFDKIHNPLKEKILNNDKKSCDLSIVLNEEKIEEDAVWDGLKGIVTNNLEISNEELIHQYSNLWQVEESFRITKHDLKIRPIYHWKPSRVKAHLAISFRA